MSISRHARVGGVAVLSAIVVSLSASVRADWPQFRGPDGNGVSASRGLPVTWAEGSNVAWKTAVHGRAWSSPIVIGRQVWVTTATPDGRKLSAVALDRDSGKIVHDLHLFDVEKPQFVHDFNTHASPTPAAEPGRVYVTFGAPGTAAIDTASGKVLWTRRDFECNHFRGAGSSPVIYGNLLLMHFDGSDHQFVVALDKRTGKTVWRTERSIDFKDLGPDGKPQAEGDMRKGFATPQIMTVEGKPVMVSIGSKATYGYEPATGKELWRVEERTSHSGSTRPVVYGDLVIYPTGFARGHLLAVRPNGRGDITESHVVWRVTRGVPNKPSVLIVGDLLFMINDGGILTCLEAKSGEVVWTTRLKGEYSASPVSAEGRVYVFSEDGLGTVFEAAREYKQLAQNTLNEGFLASPAIDGRALYVRSRTHVYRLEQAQERSSAGAQKQEP
jgi:outer membrane protein assembly factor BamB